MALPRMLILKTGNALEPVRSRFGDFEDWFMRALGVDGFDYEVCAVHQGERLPSQVQLRTFSGLVITGSPAMVSHRHDWSERTAAWLAEQHDRGLPMLGVCYGHQLLAHALGGEVGPSPHGLRMGTFGLEPADATGVLLHESRPGAGVHRTHVEVVLTPPSGAWVMARSEGDPYHALEFAHQCWGVQFHPEFDTDIMAGYIQARRDQLEAEGQDADALLRRIEPAPLGDRVLRRFARLCQRLTETADAAVGA